TQSVSCQPVASPGPPALTHDGLEPSATILSDRAIRRSHVCGTVYPLASKALIGYQMVDLTSALYGMPQMLEPWVTRPMVLACSSLSFLPMKGATSMTLPWAA